MNRDENKIARKDFLQQLMRVGAGACCCAPVLASGLPCDGQPTPDQELPPARVSEEQEWIADLETRMREGSRTPAWRRMEIVGEWIQRLMANMDTLLDEAPRARLMQACGRACYLNAFGAASSQPPPPGALDAMLSAYQSRGETEIRREGNTVYYRYGPAEQNPYGLRLLDGYCMCPVVESGPDQLSPTYCQCSAGYVGEMFERLTGSPCQVEVLESLRTGGSHCRFKIELQSTS
ncbi:DUF6144 family protein [Gemmatimonadota bacterium]